MKFKYVILAFFSALYATSAFGINILRNGDFADGMAHFGFSDKPSSKVVHKIAEDSTVGKYLMYKSDANELGGLNMSEVHIGNDRKVKFSFFAKASTPLQIRLVAMANNGTDDVWRFEVQKFSIGTEWKEYSCVLDAKNKEWLDDWVPFRFEKVSTKKGEVATPEVELCFAKLRVESEQTKNDAINASVSISSRAKDAKPYTGGIVSRKEKLAVNVDFENNSNEEQERVIKWEIIDTDTNKVVRKRTKTVKIPVGKSTQTFKTKALKTNGLRRIVLSIDDKPIAGAFFVVTPTVRAPRGVLPIDIGYCGVITNGEVGAPTADEMAFLADSGISFIRTWDGGNPFNWRVIEPKEGEFFWDITDETVRLAIENNLDVVPVLGGMFFIYPPEKRNSGHRQADWLYAKSEVVRAVSGFEKAGRKAIKPPLANWESMVSAIATRYKGKIKFYEVMNEPNIIWRDHMTYYPYLESANKVLKSIDPENSVVGFSTTGDYGGSPTGFLSMLMRAGAGKFSDIVSFHSYSSLYEDSPSPADKLIGIFKKNLSDNGVNQPLWHTELYYLNPRSNLGGGDHQNGPIFHAGYLIRRYLVDAASGVKADILLPATSVAGCVQNGGVETWNFARGRYMPYQAIGDAALYMPNKRYIASAVFAETLSNFDFAKKIELSDKLIAYQFASRDSKRVVATVFALDAYMENLNRNSRNPKTKVVDPLGREAKNLGVIPTGARVFDVFGNDLPQNDDESVILPISPMPVYISARNEAQLEYILNRLR